MKNKWKLIFTIFSIGVMLYSSIMFAAEVENPDAPSIPSDNVVNIDKIDKATENLWGDFSIIIQVIAISVIVFTGLRYMFADSGSRADIKVQTVLLMLGAIFVFAAVPITKLIVNVVKDLL